MRAPRASFVITISVAALAGCGGQVEGGGGDPITDQSHNPPFDTSIDDTARDEAEVRPDAGSDARDATIGDSRIDDSAIEATPETFPDRWGVAENPPSPVCPPEEPIVGSPCSTGSWGGCTYVDRCADRPSSAPGSGDYLTCYGKWTLIGGTDYVATCPSTAPADGSSCRCAQHHYGHCTYAACPDAANVDATCDKTTGLWSVATTPCDATPDADAGSGP